MDASMLRVNFFEMASDVAQDSCGEMGRSVKTRLAASSTATWVSNGLLQADPALMAAKGQHFRRPGAESRFLLPLC